jgi:hypothetical protein
MDRGYRPEELDHLGREEMLVYLALAQLNEEKQADTMKRVFMEALAEFYGHIRR